MARLLWPKITVTMQSWDLGFILNLFSLKTTQKMYVNSIVPQQKIFLGIKLQLLFQQEKKGILSSNQKSEIYKVTTPSFNCKARFSPSLYLQVFSTLLTSSLTELRVKMHFSSWLYKARGRANRCPQYPFFPSTWAHDHPAKDHSFQPPLQSGRFVQPSSGQRK